MTEVTNITYLFVLQGKYAQGWEDLTAGYDLAEIRMDHKRYIHNEGGKYRVVRRKEEVITT